MPLGNPAPLGLLAFGLTTAMLMYVDSGWVEHEFEQFVAGYALFYGGLCQLLVAIFELFKGSSFSFAVFGSYAAFWLGWAFVLIESHSLTSEYDASLYQQGKVAWLTSFGILSFCFWFIAIRKNVCLIYVFTFLVLTFFLLAAATATGSSTTKGVAGGFGFFTAIGAFYTGIAELVNEEFGRHVLPGLAPILAAQSRFVITTESMKERISYEAKTNTLFLSFRGFQIRTLDEVCAIRDGVIHVIKDAKPLEGKVHVIVDYHDTVIARDIYEPYWDMVRKLQEQYYLSASRFHVTSFGTRRTNAASGEVGMIRASMAFSPTAAVPPPVGPVKSFTGSLHSTTKDDEKGSGSLHSITDDEKSHNC